MTEMPGPDRGQTSQQAPKHIQNFPKKRAASFLF
jgi:hypothetical protein